MVLAIETRQAPVIFCFIFFETGVVFSEQGFWAKSQPDVNFRSG